MLDKRMNNEEKLDAIYEMTLENNEVLRTIRRQQYMSSFFTIVYWLMILGVLGSTYYFVKPFIPAFISGVSKVEETVNGINQVKNQVTEQKVLNEVIKNLKPKTINNTDGAMPDNGVIDTSVVR